MPCEAAVMSFAGTYNEEIIASRRDRSRRAFFWAKITSVLLMLTIAVTLRAEPELRRVLMDAGMDAVMRFANMQNGEDRRTAQANLPFPQAQAVQAPQSQLPRSTVKVNRPAPQLDPGLSSPISPEMQQLYRQIQQIRVQP